MTERYGTEPVWRTALINEFARERGNSPRQRRPNAYERAAEAAAQPPSADVVASVLGLPLTEISPQVVEALAPLLAELDHLRLEHEQVDRRILSLQVLADRHSVVPCLNRRAFVRELDSFLRGGGQGMVVVVHVGKVEEIRQVHGMTAGEGALRHVCAILLQELRQTDMVGCLGGSDFAVLMSSCPPVEALTKLDRICSRINGPPFAWMGQPQTLTAFSGFHYAIAGEDAEFALAAADRNRRGFEP